MAVVVAVIMIEQGAGLVVEEECSRVFVQWLWRLLNLGLEEALSLISRAGEKAIAHAWLAEGCWLWKNLEIVWAEASDRFVRKVKRFHETQV